MTHEIRVLMESARFWEDLAEQWRKRGNQDAVDKCTRYAMERWASVDYKMNHREDIK